MRVQITTERHGRLAWAWLINAPDWQILAGGYCRTRREAVADARIWIDLHGHTEIVGVPAKGNPAGKTRNL